ncbi:small RNA-binding protein 11, chloroplastic-like [Nymphaea colorata]|nr:small RNA-binding protein 11, chloroplastic-like [Nymphaea colorata]
MFRPISSISFVTAARAFSTQLFVSRLSFYTTEKKLVELFSPFGVLTEARLVMDSSTQRHRGFGFVTYESEKDALKAVKALNNRIIDGRLIFVEFAKPKVASDNSS